MTHTSAATQLDLAKTAATLLVWMDGKDTDLTSAVGALLPRCVLLDLRRELCEADRAIRAHAVAVRLGEVGLALDAWRLS